MSLYNNAKGHMARNINKIIIIEKSLIFDFDKIAFSCNGWDFFWWVLLRFNESIGVLISILSYLKFYFINFLLSKN